MKLFDDEFYTHMPFVFEGKLLHCKGKDRYVTTDKRANDSEAKPRYQAYDLYVSDLDGSNSFFIGSDLGDKMIACSPNAFRDNGEIVLNYVCCDMLSGSMKYFHYQRRGATLQTLGGYKRIFEPLGIPQHCQSENARYSYTVFQSLNNSYLMQYDKRYGGWEKLTFKNLGLLKRAVVFEESSVILTYANSAGVVKSAVFDTETKFLKDIKVNGQDIYKCHLYDNKAYFSIRAEGNEYGMAIHKDNYTLEASDLR